MACPYDDFFTASKPWAHEFSLTPVPSPARAGEGAEGRVRALH